MLARWCDSCQCDNMSPQHPTIWRDPAPASQRNNINHVIVSAHLHDSKNKPAETGVLHMCPFAGPIVEVQYFYMSAVRCDNNNHNNNNIIIITAASQLTHKTPPLELGTCSYHHRNGTTFGTCSNTCSDLQPLGCRKLRNHALCSGTCSGTCFDLARNLFRTGNSLGNLPKTASKV